MATIQPLPSEAVRGPAIIARLERLEVWSLSYKFIAIIGLGFLFGFWRPVTLGQEREASKRMAASMGAILSRAF